MKKTFLLLLSFFVLSFFSYATKSVESNAPSETIESSETAVFELSFNFNK